MELTWWDADMHSVRTILIVTSVTMSVTMPLGRLSGAMSVTMSLGRLSGANYVTMPLGRLSGATFVCDSAAG
jgi:hypothetical protein